MIFTELASLIIAIIAFICSVISIVVNYEQNQKLSSLSMQSRYYEKIFDEYLINQIPKGRQYLKYIDGKLKDADKLIETLSDIKIKALYFKYNNEQFYNELIAIIDDLEKALTDFSNTTENDQDRQYINLNDIKGKIVDIYQVIYKYANGSN